MAKAVFQTTVVNAQGVQVAFAKIMVRNASDLTPATLYANRSGDSPDTSGTTQTNSQGFVRTYLNPGRYQIEATFSSQVRTWEDVVVLDDVTSGGSPEAANVTYDNGTSGLDATDVQAAIDEVYDKRFAPVADSSLSNVDATGSAAGAYVRFSHASPTYTFSTGNGLETNMEFHGRYVGAGSLTLVEDGITINPPAGGTLEIPPGGTFTVKMVDTDEADLFGVTVTA